MGEAVGAIPPSIFCVRVRWNTVVASYITTEKRVKRVYVQYSSSSHSSAQNTWKIAVGAKEGGKGEGGS